MTELSILGGHETLQELAIPLRLPSEPLVEGTASGYDEIRAKTTVSALADRLRSTGIAPQGDIRAAAERIQREIAARGQRERDWVERRIFDELNLIQDEIERVRIDIVSAANAQKTSAARAVGAGQIQVIAKTGEESNGIAQVAEEHKRAAAEAVASRKEATRRFGIDEGRRGRDAMDAQSAEAVKRGQGKAGGYPDDERGQAQAEAVLNVAAEYNETLSEPGPDLQEEIEGAAEDLADGLDGADERVTQEIETQTPLIQAELYQRAIAFLPQFGIVHESAITGIDGFADDCNRQLDDLRDAATAEWTVLTRRFAAEIEASVAQAQTLVARQADVATAAVDTLVAANASAAERLERPHVDGVRAVLEEAGRSVDTIASEFIQTGDQGGLEMMQAMGAGSDAVEAGVSAAGSAVVGQVSLVGEIAQSGLADLGGKVQEGSTQFQNEWGKVAEGARTAVDSQFGQAVAGMARELDGKLEPGRAKLTAQVDEAVAKNGEPLSQLDEKMEDAAREAREKYDAPWYEKVGRWVWGAIKGILKTVLVLLAFVAIAIAAIALILVGLVFDIVALIVIGIAVLVGLVVFMLWKIIEGIVARIQSASTWWEAIWGGVVGILDITGLPGVIEGIIQRDIVNGRRLSEEEAGERFGSGLVGLILTLLPLKGLKGKRGRAPIETTVPSTPSAPKPLPRPDAPPLLPEAPAPKVLPAGPEPPRLLPPGPDAPRALPPAAEPRALPPGPEAPKALPPSPEAPKALPPGPETPKALPPGPEAPKALPPGPEAPKALPPGPEAPKALPPGPEAPKVLPRPDEVPGIPKTTDLSRPKTDAASQPSVPSTPKLKKTAIKEKPPKAGEVTAENFDRIPGVKKLLRRIESKGLPFDKKAMIENLNKDPKVAVREMNRQLDLMEMLAEEQLGTVPKKYDFPRHVAEPLKKYSREDVLGSTPTKNSATGKHVIREMRDAGQIKGPPGKEQVWHEPSQKWYSIDECEMGHTADAVNWWNESGYLHGTKSPIVRKWMLDPDNYVLEPIHINRSRGAALTERYRAPHPDPITVEELGM